MGTVRQVIIISSALALAGCGAVTNDIGSVFGYHMDGTIDGEYPDLIAEPPPSGAVARPYVDPGSDPKIVIDAVDYYSGAVFQAGSDIKVTVRRGIYGRAFNVSRGSAKVAIYVGGDMEPLDQAYLTIQNDDTWFGPSRDDGTVWALLLSKGYRASNYLGYLPTPDGVNVLAVASWP
jgi:hypothetical protein